MKVVHSITITAAAMTLLAFSAPIVNAETNMDSRIESSAKQTYVFKTYLQNDDIKIQSRDGVVTLTGVVSENFHKSLALETVTGLPGVKSVENKLEVKDTSPTVNSDAWLRDKVKVALLFHRSVSTIKTEVEVKDGIVTLRGTATSQSQRELTAEYARNVEGIKDVNNEMTVSESSNDTRRTVGETIDDASITAQVNMTLLNHRSTSVLNTSVKTKRGVVTVGGNARDAAEKDLVTKLVTDINGVKNVRNRMTVK